MKIVGFKYSHTIHIVIIDEGIHTNMTNLNDTQTLLRQNYEAAVASCSDASTANTQAVMDTWGRVSRLVMQEPSRRSRTRRLDPHTVRLEQELQELRQQRELDLQRIASLEAQQQRLATFEAQWQQFMTGQGGDGSGGSGYGSGGGGSGCGGGGGGDGGGSGGGVDIGGDYGGGSGGGVHIGGDYVGDGGDGSDSSDEDTYSGGDDRMDGGGDVGACNL